MINSNSKFLDDNNQGNMTQQSVLNAFDFSAIEEMDPSLGKSNHIFLNSKLQQRDTSWILIEKRHLNWEFRTQIVAHKKLELSRLLEWKFCSWETAITFRMLK